MNKIRVQVGLRIVNDDGSTRDEQWREAKATWNNEAAEDLKVYHGLEIKSEMISLFAKEVGRGFPEFVVDYLTTHVQNQQEAEDTEG